MATILLKIMLATREEHGRGHQFLCVQLSRAFRSDASPLAEYEFCARDGQVRLVSRKSQVLVDNGPTSFSVA